MAAHILNENIIVNCTSSEIDPENECIHFLTHIGRHQSYLSSVISNHLKKVYTSEFNVWYLKTFFDANTRQFVAVPLWTKRKVKIRGKTFTFEFLNANHCPGAVMILIKGDFGSYLYTGNCRYSAAMLDYTSLKPYSQGVKTLDKLYVNAAYLKIEHNFPKRELVIQQILDFISDHSEEKIYICTRLLGKEDILFRIALELNEKIYVDHDKLKVLNKLGYKSNLFTTEMCLSRLRVVDVSEITWVKMKRRRLTEKCVGIIFSACNTNEEKLKKHGIYIFPASDHSSANETKLMVKAFKTTEVYLLNNDSTLSGHIQEQKNVSTIHPLTFILEKHQDTKITSPLMEMCKNEIKPRHKKKLKLKISSTGDENQPPNRGCELGSKFVSKSPTTEKQSQLSVKNIGHHTSLSEITTKPNNVATKNSQSKSSELSSCVYSCNQTNGSEKSFLCDENARTGFSSSGDQQKKLNQLSPSFPPSVSNIILTDLNSSSESFEQCSGKQLSISSEFISNNLKESVQHENYELIKFSNIKEQSDASSVHNGNCLSPSYPPSIFSTSSNQPSSESACDKNLCENISNHSCLNTEATNDNPCETLTYNNGRKTLEIQNKSELSRSPSVNLLSPSYPPSESNINLGRISEKTTFPSTTSVEDVSCVSSTETIPGVCQMNYGKKLSVLLYKNDDKMSICHDQSTKSNDLMYSSLKHVSQSSSSGRVDETSIIQGTLTESQDSDQFNRKKSKYNLCLEVISESPANSHVEETHSQVQLNGNSSFQNELIPMNMTKVIIQHSENYSDPPCPNEKVGVEIAKNSEHFVNIKNKSLFCGSHLEKHTSKQFESSVDLSNVLTEQTKTNCRVVDNSLFVPDIQWNKISINESELVNDKIQQLHLSSPLTETPLAKNDVLVKTIEFENESVLKTNDESRTKSLFSIDVQNPFEKVPKNCAELTFCNSISQSGKTINSENATNLSSIKNNVETKSPEALNSQSTILLTKEDVVCEVHQPPHSTKTFTQTKTPDIYEQSTLLSDSQNKSNQKIEKENSPNQLNQINKEQIVSGQDGNVKEMSTSYAIVDSASKQSGTNDKSFSGLSESDKVLMVTQASTVSGESLCSLVSKEPSRSQRNKRRHKKQTSLSQGLLNQSTTNDRKFTSLPLLRTSLSSLSQTSKHSQSKSASTDKSSNSQLIKSYNPKHFRSIRSTKNHSNNTLSNETSRRSDHIVNSQPISTTSNVLPLIVESSQNCPGKVLKEGGNSSSQRLQHKKSNVDMFSSHASANESSQCSVTSLVSSNVTQDNKKN